MTAASSPSSRGPAFSISLASGDMAPGLPHGLFFRDTRFLSELRLRVNGHWPEPLAATTIDPFSAAFVLRDQPRVGLADSALMVFRNRYVGRGMREDITVRNYGLEPAFCSLEFSVAADFADLFEVKEGRVEKAGDLTVHVGDQRITWSYRRGHFSRGAHLAFSRAGEAVADPRGLRGDRAGGRRVVDVPAAHAGRRRRGGDAPLPLWTAGRALDARRTPRGVAEEPARDRHRPRGVHRVARPLHRGSCRAAPLRSRVPRSHRRRGGRALVHDPVRARQPAHVVDGDARRLRPRARARCRPWRDTRAAR